MPGDEIRFARPLVPRLTARMCHFGMTFWLLHLDDDQKRRRIGCLVGQAVGSSEAESLDRGVRVSE